MTLRRLQSNLGIGLYGHPACKGTVKKASVPPSYCAGIPFYTPLQKSCHGLYSQHEVFEEPGAVGVVVVVVAVVVVVVTVVVVVVVVTVVVVALVFIPEV